MDGTLHPINPFPTPVWCATLGPVDAPEIVPRESGD